MKKVWLALVLLLGLGAAALGGYLYSRDKRISEFAQAPYGAQGARTVNIPPGTGPRTLASLLARAQVTSDPERFYAYLRREKLAPKLKAGEYEFQGALTPAQVVEKIASGQVKVYRFTIPEGLRVEEILPLLAASDLQLDPIELNRLATDVAFLRQAGVPAERLEGFLFPDTYSFTRGATEKAVLSKMVARTLEEYRKADAQRKAGVGLNLLQALTLASIVEKETGAQEERPRISCVFHNRLRLGMKLQTDPTVLYAMRMIRGTFVKSLTRADLETGHPYNTYTTPGLPPGPIANPGAAAIQAALNPLDCSDLYFVSRNDGTHLFCPDLRCHEAAVEIWQREYFRKQRQPQGG